MASEKYHAEVFITPRTAFHSPTSDGFKTWKKTRRSLMRCTGLYGSSIVQQQCNQCGEQTDDRTDDVTSPHRTLHSLVRDHGFIRLCLGQNSRGSGPWLQRGVRPQNCHYARQQNSEKGCRT